MQHEGFSKRRPRGVIGGENRRVIYVHTQDGPVSMRCRSSTEPTESRKDGIAMYPKESKRPLSYRRF